MIINEDYQRLADEVLEKLDFELSRNDYEHAYYTFNRNGWLHEFIDNAEELKNVMKQYREKVFWMNV